MTKPTDLITWPSFHPGITRNVALWADNHRILPRGTSQHPGRWITDRFPYLRGPMKAFSSTKVRMIVLKWATQLGKTEIQLNCIGYVIDEAPGPTLAVYPNESISRKVSETRIMPMVKATPRLREKALPESKMLQMHFMDGTILYLASAQVPSELASMPIQYLFCDELGKFPTFSGKEGDPVKLAMERLKSFSHTSKTVLVSSPTTPDGPISRYFDTCQERLEYFIPCPHCGVPLLLDFKCIKWDLEGMASASPRAWRHVKKTAQYFCPHCENEITNNEKNATLIKGQWLREDGEQPDMEAESIGFKLSSLYSPLLTWGDMGSEFLKVKNDPPMLMVFKNGWLCQEWEDTVFESMEPEAVLNSNIRKDVFPRTVPADTLALVMGVDSQASGFYYVVRAWRRDRSSVSVDYGFFPSLADVETAALTWSFPIQGTQKRMRIWRAAIDTGGTRLDEGLSMTEQIYHWLRRLPKKGIIHGIKGRSWSKDPSRVKMTIIDKMPGKGGGPIPGGIALFLLDTGQFKDALAYRLSLKPEDPGAFLLHAETGNEYAYQLLSERKRRDTRTGKESWEPKPGMENHYLDAEIYGMAATDTQFLGGLDVLAGPVGIVDDHGEKILPAAKMRHQDEKMAWIPKTRSAKGWLQ